MLHDAQVSFTAVAAWLGWFVAVVLALVAWVVMAAEPERWRWSLLLMGSGAIVSAGAATASVRVYALRSLELTRAVAGLRTNGDDDGDDGPRPTGVSSIR